MWGWGVVFVQFVDSKKIIHSEGKRWDNKIGLDENNCKYQKVDNKEEV